MKGVIVGKKNKFPSPDCKYGYSWVFLNEIMDEETFDEFSKWMSGQTCTLCDGRRYDHEAKAYFPSECAESPHGGVAYRWDVERFLGFHGKAAKEMWD